MRLRAPPLVGPRVDPCLGAMRETEGQEYRGNQREGKTKEGKAVRRMRGRMGRDEFIKARRRRDTSMWERGWEGEAWKDLRRGRAVMAEQGG